jgi:hypothetical protein
MTRLAGALLRYVESNHALCQEATGILREMDEENFAAGRWENRYTAEILSILYAKRMTNETATKQAGHWVPFTKLDWKKHMTPEETVYNAKRAIGSFLKAHETGLTGRALAAKNLIDSLPEQGRKEIRESLVRDREGDFKDVEEAVVAKFSAMYSSIEPEDRSKAFMELFDMVRGEMRQPQDDIDADAIAYLAAERIFLKGYERSAEKMGIGDEYKKTTFEIFTDRLKAQEFALIGTAAEARDILLNADDNSQKIAIDFVDRMPQQVRDGFQKAISIFLDSTNSKEVTLQQVFDALLPIMKKNASWDASSSEDALDLSKEMRELFDGRATEVLTYVIAEKVLRQGFLESQKALPLATPVDASALWSDQELTSAGRALWERTYKIGGDDSDVVEASRGAALNWGEAARAKGVLVNDGRIAVAEAVFGFAAKWAVHAFQRITTTHTYAAALMCTDASKDVLQDIEMQWHAFMVCLPNGLLTYKDEEIGLESEYTRILVASFSDSASLILLNQNGGKTRHRLVVQVGNNIADVLDADATSPTPINTVGAEMDVSTGTQDKVRRIFILAKRLVAGLLLALQNQNNFKSRVSPSRDGKKKREHDDPQHRVVFIGAPLKIDCRPQVADYINNGSHKRKGAPPAVQLLVRGHHKRQVVGVGRIGRKVIFVQPYWRGPEDAPILTRPKQVGP